LNRILLPGSAEDRLSVEISERRELVRFGG
jgi:hypothetical protein